MISNKIITVKARKRFKDLLESDSKSYLVIPNNFVSDDLYYVLRRTNKRWHSTPIFEIISVFKKNHRIE